MKFSVSIYSYSQAIRKGILTPLTAIATAKEQGFDGIEITDDIIVNAEDPIEMCKALKAEADRLGMTISNFAVGANLLAEDQEAEIATLCKKVDYAEIMGCPTMRHDVCKAPAPYQSYEKTMPKLVDAIRKVTEYAASKGIKTMTENHGFYSQDSTRVEALINAVDNPNFGQLIDMGNFLCADEDSGIAVGRCAPYAFYVHAKDFIFKSGQDPHPGDGWITTRAGNLIRGTVIGHGVVPIVQDLRALKRVKYDGWIAIEFEGMEECVKAVQLGLINLKKYVAEVYGV